MESALLTVAEGVKDAGCNFGGIVDSFEDAVVLVSVKDILNRLVSEAFCTEQNFPVLKKLILF